MKVLFWLCLALIAYTYVGYLAVACPMGSDSSSPRLEARVFSDRFHHYGRAQRREKPACQAAESSRTEVSAGQVANCDCF